MPTLLRVHTMCVCITLPCQVGERIFLQADKPLPPEASYTPAMQLTQTLYWILCLLPLEPFFPGALCMCVFVCVCACMRVRVYVSVCALVCVYTCTCVNEWVVFGKGGEWDIAHQCLHTAIHCTAWRLHLAEDGG